MKSTLTFLLALCLLPLNTACEENTQQVDEHAPEIILSGDSIPLDDTPTVENQSIQPDLLGKWALTSTRFDGEEIPIEAGESSLEFRKDGTMISESAGLSTEMFAFIQEGSRLACNMWDHDQKIVRLNTEELVLAEEVDGQSVEYIYKRMP
ncbi:MAG: hypothetical protein AAF206_23495 [Bacteroidota bacterium]